MPATATVQSPNEKFTSPQLVGLSIAEVLEEFGDVLNISEGYVALINGERVDEDRTVNAGETLVFNRPSGQKG